MIATVFCRRAALAGLLAGVAIVPAFAGDRPATPEGARTVQAFLDRFVPAPPAGGSALVSVKPDGQAYILSVDLAAVNGLFKGAGVGATYEPATLVYKLFEQDDGKWRVVQDSLPRIVTRTGDATSVFEVENYRQTLVVDPQLAWWTSGAASAGKGLLTAEAPKLAQAFDFGSLAGDYATTVKPDGAVSSTVRQAFGDVGFKISVTDKDGNPVASSGRLESASVNLGVDGLNTRKLFDLVSLLSVHRADLAQHESELKDLLRTLAAPGTRFVEGGEATKLMIASPIGAIALAGAKLGVGVTNAGPDSAVDATLDAEGLSLPAGLAPPNAADLTPSKVNLAFTVKGIDIAAAAAKAIESLRLGGPGPAISDDDSARVSAALIGAGPLKVVLAPSHVVAPAIDADLAGEMRYAAGRTSGVVTIRMRNFDRTMSAVRELGPEVAAKSLPMVAMAKGLAKTESDGALSWLVEIGDDRSITVNGVRLSADK
ncbi:hypothetical protein DFR50_11875 [Roseiarcus fermentans]|uniref:DUF2125 domain-containing protein n=1 Tax=Roseiarcus fermentans TaxID=1473586 RepID=A0A366F9Z8_9HYPH|nr:hypothetical protein [Roseiarcus fermentans]RBP10589.1 hypothetical protein DFR50_11875 [Roseiarcus fermentans]